MTRTQYKATNQMIRSIYRGITNPWEAYRTAHTKINIKVGGDDLSVLKMMHEFNYSTYCKVAGIQ